LQVLKQELADKKACTYLAGFVTGEYFVGKKVFNHKILFCSQKNTASSSGRANVTKY
jgi:hypothetical protein